MARASTRDAHALCTGGAARSSHWIARQPARVQSRRVTLARRFDPPSAALLLGAMLGALGAAYEIVMREPAPPTDALVLVDSVPIGRAELQSALEAARADTGRPLDAKERASVLERLVDDELLLQYALELELPRREPRLRAAILAALVSELADAEHAEPSDAELRALFEAEPARFAYGAEPAPGFEAVREPLRAEWLRRRAGERLAETLRALREDKPIVRRQAP